MNRKSVPELPTSVLSKFADSSRPPSSVFEVQELAQDAQRGPDEDSTLVPCPRCRRCSLCGGTNMVTPEVALAHKSDPPPPISLHLDELDETSDEGKL